MIVARLKNSFHSKKSIILYSHNDCGIITIIVRRDFFSYSFVVILIFPTLRVYRLVSILFGLIISHLIQRLSCFMDRNIYAHQWIILLFISSIVLLVVVSFPREQFMTYLKMRRYDSLLARHGKDIYHTFLISI